MRSGVDEFKSFANDATLGARADELHDLADQVLIESEASARLRDTLLPHLVSGRLTVRDAEETVSDAV